MITVHWTGANREYETVRGRAEHPEARVASRGQIVHWVLINSAWQGPSCKIISTVNWIFAGSDLSYERTPLLQGTWRSNVSGMLGVWYSGYKHRSLSTLANTHSLCVAVICCSAVKSFYCRRYHTHPKLCFPYLEVSTYRQFHSYRRHKLFILGNVLITAPVTELIITVREKKHGEHSYKPKTLHSNYWIFYTSTLLQTYGIILVYLFVK